MYLWEDFHKIPWGVIESDPDTQRKCKLSENNPVKPRFFRRIVKGSSLKALWQSNDRPDERYEIATTAAWTGHGRERCDAAEKGAGTASGANGKPNDFVNILWIWRFIGKTLKNSAVFLAMYMRELLKEIFMKRILCQRLYFPLIILDLWGGSSRVGTFCPRERENANNLWSDRHFGGEILY